MKKEFQEVKQIIIDLAKQNDACKEQFVRALESTNYSELLKVVVDNANWCYKAKIFSSEVLSLIDLEVLNENNIYYSQKDIKQTSGMCIYHSSTSKHYGSSTSEHYESSTSKHYESSTSKHYHSSTSDHYESSTSKHYGSFGSFYSIKNLKAQGSETIIKEHSTSKIYIKKSQQELVTFID